MTTCSDPIEASSSTTLQDEWLLAALCSKPETLEQDYLKAYVPLPTARYHHILRTQSSGIRGSALPPAWRPVQLALARALWLDIKPGEKTCNPCTELVDGLPDRYNSSLKKLLMVLYYHQVQELVGEMNSAGTDTRKQREILGKLAESLQRYSKSVFPLNSNVMVVNSYTSGSSGSCWGPPVRVGPYPQSSLQSFRPSVHYQRQNFL